MLLWGQDNFRATQIPNLTLWLDGSDLSTITKDGSDLISQWNDKSGNGNNVTTTGAARPTSAAGIQNGKAVARFLGGDFISSASIASNAASTIFIVFQSTNTYPTSGTDVDMLFRHDDPGGSNDYALTSTNGVIDATAPGFRRENGGTVNLMVNGSATTSPLNPNEFYIGRAESSSNPSYSGVFTFGATAGGSFSLIGDIGEILIYDRTLSAAEVTAAETYLSNKWAITLA